MKHRTFVRVRRRQHALPGVARGGRARLEAVPATPELLFVLVLHRVRERVRRERRRDTLAVHARGDGVAHTRTRRPARSSTRGRRMSPPVARKRAHRLSPTPTYPRRTRSRPSRHPSRRARDTRPRASERLAHRPRVCLGARAVPPVGALASVLALARRSSRRPPPPSASPPNPGGHWRPYRYAQPPGHSTHGPSSYEPETHRPVAPHHPHPGARMHGSRSPMAPHRASHAGKGSSGSRGVRCGVVCSGHADVSNRDMHCGFRAGFMDRASHHAHPYSLKHSPITARCFLRARRMMRGWFARFRKKSIGRRERTGCGQDSAGARGSARRRRFAVTRCVAAARAGPRPETGSRAPDARERGHLSFAGRGSPRAARRSRCRPTGARDRNERDDARIGRVTHARAEDGTSAAGSPGWSRRGRRRVRAHAPLCTARW